MGGGAEERIEHAVFSARASCLCLVYAETGASPLRGDGAAAGAWIHEQVSSHQLSISAFAFGLLAAATDWRCGGDRARVAGRGRSATVEGMAGVGKSSAPAAFCRERGGHDEGAKGWRCRPVFFPVQPVIAAGDCRDFLCALLGESTLAVEVGSVVSASHSALPCVASNRGRGSIAGDQRLGTSRARSTLSRCRMVLVSREPGADDWVGAGGRSGHGGPIRLHSVHRFVCHGNMAGG